LLWRLTGLWLLLLMVLKRRLVVAAAWSVRIVTTYRPVPPVWEIEKLHYEGAAPKQWVKLYS